MLNEMRACPPSYHNALWILAALLASLFLLSGCRRGRATERGEHRPSRSQSWTLANQALELTIAQDAQGRMGMSRLHDRRTGYAWGREQTPSPIFQVEFSYRGERTALSGRSRFDLLEQSRTLAADGTQLLHLRVRARQQPLEVDLYWRLRPGFSPVEKWYTVTNRGEEPVTIWRLGTFSQLVDAGEEPLSLRYVQKGMGAHGSLRVRERPLQEGETENILCSAGESRDLLDCVPWFLLDAGPGRGGLLYAWAFSAPGRFTIARAATTAIVTGGLEPETFKHDLLAGRTLTAPTGLFGPYAGSADDAVRDWHRFLRQYWAPPPPDPLFPRVHYNTWLTYGLRVNEANCMRQLRAAADLGAELFHIDAGWYRATGDWRPDPARFPRGLRPLSQEAHRRGMKFGLWVAFTQISEQMLKEHPDWITKPGEQIRPDRPWPFRTLTICLGNPVARDWIRRELERIIVEYELDMLEYDQPIIEDCKVATHGHQAGDGAYAATLGFYELYDHLRRRFPNLLLENCMNGGHIMDFGVLARTHYTSITDNTEPLRGRSSVYGASFPFPAYACELYMEDYPGFSPDFLFRSYMMGLWTLSADITSWDQAKRESARAHIALYKRLRPLIRSGDVYHILPQARGRDWDGLQYYDARTGEGVLFVFRPKDAGERRRVQLAGLEDGEYEIQWEGETARHRVAGSTLKEEGFSLHFPRPNTSAILHFRRRR